MALSNDLQELMSCLKGKTDRMFLESTELISRIKRLEARNAYLEAKLNQRKPELPPLLK